MCFQVKKLQERVSKAKEDVQKNKEKYEAALREIKDYNPKYVEVSPTTARCISCDNYLVTMILL